MRNRIVALAMCSTLLVSAAAMAQQPGGAPAAAPAPAPLPALGTSLSLDQAKQAAAAAFAEAKKNNWIVAVAICDLAGELVYFEKADGTQFASVKVAIDKARSASIYRRPTKVFQDGLAGGNYGLLTLTGMNGIEGGHPIIAGGKLIGSIGVSGVTSAQDGIIARAGAEVIK
jgi:glc operon protein GlcG